MYEQLDNDLSQIQKSNKKCNCNICSLVILMLLNIFIIVYSSVLVTIFKDNYIQFFASWVSPMTQYIFLSISALLIFFEIALIILDTKFKNNIKSIIYKNLLIISYTLQILYIIFYILSKVKYPLEINPVFEPYENQTRILLYSSTKQKAYIEDQFQNYTIKLKEGYNYYILDSQKFKMQYKEKEYNVDLSSIQNFSVYSDFHTQLQANDRIPNNVQLLVHAGDIANGWKADTFNSLKGVKVPLLQAIGNHDYFIPYFRKHFRTIYKQKIGDTLFIFLQTTYGKGDVSDDLVQESIQFLNQLEYDPSIKNTFIINHQPLYKEYSQDDQYQQLLQTINQMANKFKIRAIFSGHRHKYIALHQNNPDIYDYVVSSLGLPNGENYVDSPDFVMTSDTKNIVQIQIYNDKIVYNTINTETEQSILEQVQYLK